MSNSKAAGIYSITSKVNGKRYIGSSNRICVRWTQHLQKLKSNNHHNTYLQNHYNKYGENDLLFAVVEVVERGDLSLQDFKSLLLEREQAYLDNWEECHFNIQKIAVSSLLGCKHRNPKNYCYYEERGVFRVYFDINLKRVHFGSYDLEENAIKEVEYLRSLSDKDKLLYHKTSGKNKKGMKIGTVIKDKKGYYFHKSCQRWKVMFEIDNYMKTLGSFKTEEEAINQALYVKSLTEDEIISYYNKYYKNKKNKGRNKNTKGYYYIKRNNKWRVSFKVNGVEKSYGMYKTEEEARQKAEQVKQELGGYY